MRSVATLAAVATLLLAGCSGDPAPPEPEASVPSGFAVPAGVELSEPGSTLEPGDPGTVVLELGDGSASAVTVTVDRIRKGTLRDFRFFSLDDAGRDATPFYVDVTLRNDGPAGLGGTTLPLLARTDAPMVYPASELVGDFEACPTAAVPETFLEGAETDLCFIYFVPKGERLTQVDLQPGDEADAIHWTRPSD